MSRINITVVDVEPPAVPIKASVVRDKTSVLQSTVSMDKIGPKDSPCVVCNTQPNQRH
jgi:hypothetical protein